MAYPMTMTTKPAVASRRTVRLLLAVAFGACLLGWASALAYAACLGFDVL